MVIYPAIDIKDGKCVRLVQGRFEDVTVYSDDPLEVARSFERAGAQYLHVVDLDGARLGSPQNADIISGIAASAGIPVQTGGGIRTLETAGMLLGRGIKRGILGTSAVNDPMIVKTAAEKFNSSFAIAIDAKDGLVATEGWARTSGFTAVEFARKMEELGAKVIIYTDISRDGMLKGPNIRAMEEMVKAVGMEVIASGGVTSIQDIKDLKNAGVAGAIVGKALYTGNIDLREAIEAAK